MKKNTNCIYRKVLLMLCVMNISLPIFSQKFEDKRIKPISDFTTQFVVDLHKSLYKGFSLNLYEELHIKQNSTKFDQLHSRFSLNYYVNKHFQLSAAYAYIFKIKSRNLFQHQHRVHLDFVGKVSVNRWNFSLRERPMLTQTMGSYDAAMTSNPMIDLRSRILVEYGKFLKPYVSCEVWNTLNAPKYAKGNYISRVRNELGLKWTITQGHTLNFAYRLEFNNKRDIEIERVDGQEDRVILERYYFYKHAIRLVYTFDWK